MVAMNPFALQEIVWPNDLLYRQQREIMDSVERNTETICVAANQCGKDWIAGRIALSYFVRHPVVRIITTSASERHLTVLWAEIREAMRSAVTPLDHVRGGPIRIQDAAMEAYKIDPKTGVQCPTSRMLGMVSEKAEGFAGWHSPHTLCIFDEASSINDMAYSQSRTWAKRRLLIGNAHSKDNYFYRAIKEGDVVDTNHKPAPGEPQRYFRKIITIRAQDTPNVQLGLEEIARGRTPSNRVLVPGLLTWEQYAERRATWTEKEQCIGLDARFWEGADDMLVPPTWLAKSVEFADELERDGVQRTARAMGIDTASGGDDTVFTVVDEYGVIEMVSKKTRDTSSIVGDVVALGKKHKLPSTQWVFDAGGGGREHADRLRMLGHRPRTVGFGETATPPLHTSKTTLLEKQETKDIKRAYVNKRAEMYGDLRMLLDPSTDVVAAPIYRDRPFAGFGIPMNTDPLKEVHRQLGAIPYYRDEEGRMRLPSKDKKSRSNPNEVTLKQLLGCSPDEADSLVLAVHGMLRSTPTFVVRALF